MQELQRNQPKVTHPLAPRTIGSGVRTGGDAYACGTVQITWGALIQDLDVAGMTVGEVQAEVQEAYNMAPGVQINVNGAQVEADTVLVAGDDLEFVRAAGEKGEG